MGGDCIGSGGLGCEFAWHAKQCSSVSFTALSIPGNNTDSRKSAFVLACPWCPLCAIFTICCCRDPGIRIHVPRNNTLL